MDNSLRIFVCGTYQDLAKERTEVLEAIRKLSYSHDSMEYFGARSTKAIDTCLEEVQKSDILVIIVGYLYGNLVTELNVSYTEAEYQEAYRLGKPCLVYFRSEDVPILPKFKEDDPNKVEKLRHFKDTLRNRYTIGSFRDAHDLSLSVTADLSRIAQNLKTTSDSSQGPKDIIKLGVEEWNIWRAKQANKDASLKDIDLRGINLKGANLSGINLRQAKLIGSDLSGANLSVSDLTNIDLSDAQLVGAQLKEANLCNAILNRARLNNANLTQAKLNKASLIKAELENADLSETDLSETNLSGADLINATLTEANLNGAFLVGTNFSRANLNKTKFSTTNWRDTNFGFTDLTKAIDIETITHLGPSSIGIETIYNAKGRLPEVFLRGCGLNDYEIEFTKLADPSLTNQEIDHILYKIHDLRAEAAIQISPLFISYSHSDSEFVTKLEIYLNNKGIRFWRDLHDMKAGRVEKQIDQAIRQNPTVLLILSEHSVQSDWVEHEVRTARYLEKQMGRDVLCPVALDNSWKNAKWQARLMEVIMEYNILDFSTWKDDSKFESAFNKLITGLQLFYRL